MLKVKKFSGQGLVEFALVLPILLILMIGALDYGFAFFTKVELENSAREGAYYMVYHRNDFSENIDGRNLAIESTYKAVRTEGENSGVAIEDDDINVKCIDATGDEDIFCLSGSTVIVTVQNKMYFAVDIFGNGPLNLTGDARMLIP